MLVFTSSVSLSCNFLTVLGNRKDIGPRLRRRVWGPEVLQLVPVLLFDLRFGGCSHLCQNLNHKDIFFCLNCVHCSLALQPNCFCPLFSVLMNLNVLLENCHLLGCPIVFQIFFFFFLILQAAEFCIPKNFPIGITGNTQIWKMAAKQK